MKNTYLVLAGGIMLNVACSDNKTASVTTVATEINKNTQPGIEGEWQQTAVGTDDNHNGTLDDAEIKTKGKMLGGYDYFHFYANGKCIFDKDIKFDGTYVIKPDKKNQKAIFIYGSGMPAGISQEEKDKAAYVYRIKSVEDKKLVLAPAHLAGTLVVYKRL